jgi:CRISPR-associated endonuclease/helicase Cas3
LARITDKGLLPLEGEVWSAETRQYAEVSAAAYKLDRLPLPDQMTPEVSAVKEGWPDWMQTCLVVCPLDEAGAICEGLSYDRERGLIFGSS